MQHVIKSIEQESGGRNGWEQECQAGVEGGVVVRLKRTNEHIALCFLAVIAAQAAADLPKHALHIEHFDR